MREQGLGFREGVGPREPCLEALSLHGEPQLQLVGRQADVVPGRVVAGPAGQHATVCHGARAHGAAADVDPACYDSNYGQRRCMRADASTPSTDGRRERMATEARWAVKTLQESQEQMQTQPTARRAGAHRHAPAHALGGEDG